MNLNEVIEAAKDQITVSRVFGEPYERDGVTVVPVARIYGGAGGGTGEDGAQHGEGGGVGFVARPAGVYVIRAGEVSWRPAVDANRVVTAVAVVLVVGALARALSGRRAQG
jgi:uncharacterized spore protein YtfJ